MSSTNKASFESKGERKKKKYKTEKTIKTERIVPSIVLELKVTSRILELRLVVHSCSALW